MTRKKRAEFCQDQYQLSNWGRSKIAAVEEWIGEQDLETTNTDNSFEKQYHKGRGKDNS